MDEFDGVGGSYMVDKKGNKTLIHRTKDQRENVENVKNAVYTPEKSTADKGAE